MADPLFLEIVLSTCQDSQSLPLSCRLHSPSLQRETSSTAVDLHPWLPNQSVLVDPSPTGRLQVALDYLLHRQASLRDKGYIPSILLRMRTGVDNLD